MKIDIYFETGPNKEPLMSVDVNAALAAPGVVIDSHFNGVSYRILCVRDAKRAANAYQIAVMIPHFINEDWRKIYHLFPTIPELMSEIDPELGQIIRTLRDKVTKDEP